MPPFVGLFVECCWKTPVGFWRDDRGNFVFKEGGAQPVCIKRAVGEQVIGGQIFDQFRNGAQVMRLPGHQPEIDEVTQAVGQRQYLGGDTAA